MIWHVPTLHREVLPYSLLLASERSERDTLGSVQLRIADIYIMFSTGKKIVLIQRIHVPFESLTFSVARELKLRDGFH